MPESKTTKAKKWTALKIDCRPIQNEEILAMIYCFASSGGVEIKEYENGARNSIIVYFAEAEAPKAISALKKRITDAKDITDGNGNITFDEYTVDEEDWANSWKKFFSPKKLGKKILVTPDWDEYKPARGELPIFIEPGMAFGTGHHETTELCVKLLEEIVKKDDIVFDVGTGTAILAIAAKLLGAKLAVGTDNDKYAVRIARENIKLNKCSGEVKAYYGNLLSFRSKLRDELLLQKCDVIICNILKDAVLKLPNQLKDFLRGSGVVIVSGILESQYEEVRREFEKNGFKSARHAQKNDWVACSFKLK
ncbi:MAG: Ribosomal protein L11 methyltransferase [bacterium ADurb.Bin243]|nr:MAG: Ribosomal protein L11 methyltransferase [bacterium ADurb.Bin243]